MTATKLGNASDDETRFRVLIDTHVVDLSGYDLAGSIALEGLDQTWVSPADEPVVVARTGHHIDAYLYFPGSAMPFTLVLRDLGDVPERRLTFE